jgi:hypothetical protein
MPGSWRRRIFYALKNKNLKGSIVYDQKLYAMVTDMLPLTNLIQSSDAFASVYGMAMTLLRDE